MVSCVSSDIIVSNLCWKLGRSEMRNVCMLRNQSDDDIWSIYVRPAISWVAYYVGWDWANALKCTMKRVVIILLQSGHFSRKLRMIIGDICRICDVIHIQTGVWWCASPKDAGGVAKLVMVMHGLINTSRFALNPTTPATLCSDYCVLGRLRLQ